MTWKLLASILRYVQLAEAEEYAYNIMTIQSGAVYMIFIYVEHPNSVPRQNNVDYFTTRLKREFILIGVAWLQ